ncbi:MAG: preprotein translocase subunit SecE [Ekhidna sp.]|nr:preprotein translocase subunit SecE [Ekhidna sp.]MBC6410212.1 preprotein translocase subunit SecE [Ekhidna sp.]MBC6425441.1 preprotein translocase subunit SecE [Ekhidna sp.]
MSKIAVFFKESYDELTHKVSWPKYSELQNSAILVLVASLVFALMIGVIDYVFDNLMGFIYEEL